MSACLPDQLLADPLPLRIEKYGEIRQIATEGEIRDRPRGANQNAADPGRHDKIRVFDHLLDPVGSSVGRRAPKPESINSRRNSSTES